MLDIYNRVCDVQCLKCEEVYYSQPYDFGKKVNAFKDLKDNKIMFL